MIAPASLRPRHHRGRLSPLAPLLLAFSLACSQGGDREESESVLASVAGEPVRMSDVREVAGDQLDQLDFQYRRQRHQIIDAALQDAVRQRLLEQEAEARGMPLEQLVAEITAEAPTVTDADVTAWYETNASALGGLALEDIRPQIRQFIAERRRESALAEFAAELARDKDVQISLEPFRVEFENEGAPALGPEDAPVTLIEFSDFECPYCGRFFSTLQRLKQEYGDSLRIVYRHYPLDNHPNAFQAARASMCAADQGRFWEMHDLLFQEQDRLGSADLEEKARRLGLDVATFAACLASDSHVERIERDMREGDRVGVDGTPALFVNGIPVPGGAAPYEVVAEMIDEELARRAAD